MKYSEFIRWLKAQGVQIEPGKGSHHKARYNGRRESVPDHGAKEMPEGLRRKIVKTLGL